MDALAFGYTAVLLSVSPLSIKLFLSANTSAYSKHNHFSLSSPSVSRKPNRIAQQCKILILT